MRLAGAKIMKIILLKFFKYVKLNLFLLIFADNPKEILRQAYKINKWGKNVYVKIPVVNSKGLFMGQIIKELSNKGIKLNITAVYTYEQTRKIYKCLNKKTKSIISIFAGRMADQGKDPVPIFKKSIFLTKKNKNVEILWASTREPYNYIQAKQLKCNIITVPPKIIAKIDNFGKSFNKLTLDTVKAFYLIAKNQILKYKFNCILVAGEGFEPSTFRL